MPVAGSNTASRDRPASTTTRTPSMVRLVSAMAVAGTTLRRPGGAGSMARRWVSRSSSPYSGTRSTWERETSPAASVSCTRRISAWPGRNTSTLPCCSARARNTVRPSSRSRSREGVQGAPYTTSTGWPHPAPRMTGPPRAGQPPDRRPGWRTSPTASGAGRRETTPGPEGSAPAPGPPAGCARGTRRRSAGRPPAVQGRPAASG